MNKDPFDYLQPHIVSLGLVGSTPVGSGTLIQFSTPIAHVYAVLTATHVLEELGIFSNVKSMFNTIPENKIVLSKPIDREGNVRGMVLQKFGFYTEVDKKHYRHLLGNHGGVYQNSERDVAILILSIKKLTSNDLIDHSNFFDLDINPIYTPLVESCKYVFYKGSCKTSEEVYNVLTNTGICIVESSQVKITPKAKIPCNTARIIEDKSYKGSSGAGIWVFCKTESGVQQILKGVIVETEKGTHINAIDISYIYNDFLPKFKNQMMNLEIINLNLNAKR